MIVTCPNCETKYNLPDDKIGEAGSKVRCSRCKHVFTVTPEPADSISDDLADIMTDDEGRPEPDREKNGSGLSIGLDEMEERPEKKKKKGGAGKKIFLTLFIILLLLAGGAATAYYAGVLPYSEYIAQYMPDLSKWGIGGESAPEAGPEDSVKKIALEDVRQYVVSNEKAGQLVVIEGKAVNTFDSPRELITVESTLFDAQGQALATKRVVGGNILSYFQLQILSRQEIESALSSEMGVLGNNTNVQPGQAVPFMVVFFDPPENVAEFGVKVIESKNPPGS